MSNRLLLAGALGALCLADAALAQGFTGPLFGPPEQVGGDVLIVSDTAAGDLDGDGLAEFVTRSDSSGVLVFPNQGGSLALPALYHLPPFAFPLGVLLADLDGDGALDVITADPNSHAYTLQGLGDGTLAPYVDALALPPNTQRIALGDVDGDGWPDLVSGTYGLSLLQGSVDVARGLGDGTFAAPQTAGLIVTPKAGAQAIRVRDLEGDGSLDIVVQCVKGFFQTNIFDVLHGAGDGTFLVSEVLLEGTSFDFELADVDDDGLVDLLAEGSQQSEVVALGQPGGTFGAATVLSIGSTLGGVRLVDLDLDGCVDLLGEQGFAQRLGPGAQLLGAALPLGHKLSLAAAADLDGDALPDVAYADGSAWPNLACVVRNVLGPVIDAGYGSAAGPTLVIAGDPVAGAAVTLQVSGPTTGTLALVVIGWEPAHTSLGAADLVPSTEVLLGVTVGVPLATRWPAWLAPGAPLYMQAVVPTPVPVVSHAFVVVP